MAKLRIGTHVYLRNTVFETIQNEKDLCQLFLGSPLTYQVRKLTRQDRENVINHCNLTNFKFYVHCPYIINLANDEIANKGLFCLQEIIHEIESLNSSAVLHIGKSLKLDRREAMNKVINRLNDLSIKGDGKLLLENAAGQGSEIGKDWDELQYILEKIDTNKIQLCLDTQHTFSSGMCNFSLESLPKFLEKVDDMPVQLFHLNDSQKVFGCKVDRHEDIGKGYIWKDENLTMFLDYCVQKSKDIILETNHPYDDLNKIKTSFNCKC